ncbi:MAG TPA: AAA family ATPase [Thermoanaerobaculia bacterium]|nr:AAA family ATPase [Thermoanaerobaculia bacterium]
MRASDAPPLRPSEVFEALRKDVVGQDSALRDVSVAVVKHLLGHPAGNILLIGNSGSGKTTLIKAVERFLASRPELRGFSTTVRINANVLAEAHQTPATAVLGRLYERARSEIGAGARHEEVVRRVEHGIVFIDEVDKIRAHVGSSPNVRGIVAQEALLTLIENENVAFTAEGRSAAANSSSILFIAAGAFEELYESVFKRATIGADVMPLRPIVVVSKTGEVREETPFNLRDYLKHDDLFRYGMAPQFISRFESIIVLDDLGEAELASIFIDPDDSVFRTSRDYFRQFGLDLQITRGALLAIAWDASRQKRLGARALGEVYRRVVGALEFEPASANKSEGTVTIDEEMIRSAIADRQSGARVK